MESAKRGIKYQFIESKKFIFGFFGVILLVDLFFYILNASSLLENVGFNVRIWFSIGMTNDIKQSILAINIMPILISLLVYNYEMYYEDFPLSLSFSLTRKDFFLSAITNNVYIALVFATIQGVLMKIDPILVKSLGREVLYDFIYFNTQTDSLLFIIFTLFIIFLTFIAFWNLIASLNYKFGYIIWIIFAVVNILLSMGNINFISNTLNSIGSVFSLRLGITQFINVFLGIGIFYILNYLILSRTNIKRKVG